MGPAPHPSGPHRRRRPGVTAIARVAAVRLTVRSASSVMRFMLSPDARPDELERIAVAAAWAFDVPITLVLSAVEDATSEVRR